jgi:hypothetical protein
MRDDIHKKVPRTNRVRQWVKLAVNDADREQGRSLLALDDAIADGCRREISAAFRRALVKTLQYSLFGTLEHVHSARDLGSLGGHMEAEILSETKRLLACGHSRDTAAEAGLASVLKSRVEADIRATEPVLLGTKASKARIVLQQMRRDALAANYERHARSVLANERRVARSARPHVDADENMLGDALAGGCR